MLEGLGRQAVFEMLGLSYIVASRSLPHLSLPPFYGCGITLVCRSVYYLYWQELAYLCSQFLKMLMQQFG